jgi:hypothetical protein
MIAVVVANSGHAHNNSLDYDTDTLVAACAGPRDCYFLYEAALLYMVATHAGLSA